MQIQSTSSTSSTALKALNSLLQATERIEKSFDFANIFFKSIKLYKNSHK